MSVRIAAAAAAMIIAGWPAQAQDEPKAGKASGHVTSERHSFKVVSCVATWKPAREVDKKKEGAELRVYLFSFPLAKEDVAKVLERQDVSLAESKPNPDAALWKHAPYAVLQMTFDPSAPQASLDHVKMWGLSVNGAKGMGIGITRDPAKASKEISGFVLTDGKSVRLKSKVTIEQKRGRSEWELDVDAPLHAER